MKIWNPVSEISLIQFISDFAVKYKTCVNIKIEAVGVPVSGTKLLSHCC